MTNFNKRVYGLVIIKSENSNFNADFTGNPRRLPDESGTIYATDKALKYAIRKYWIDNGKNVFVWRTYKEKNGDYTPNTLEGRYNNLKNDNDKIPEDVFSKCIDVKMFGITFAMKSKNKADSKNLSLTGPLQISYGVNKFKEDIIFTNSILSPYADGEDAKSTTLGNESRGKKVYYAYDFSINPNNITNHYEDVKIKDKLKLNNEDINSLKDALKYGVTNLNTTTKKGSSNIMLLWIELDENSKNFLPEMKNLIEITEENEKTLIDLSKLKAFLNSKDNLNIKLYYNEHFTEIKDINDNWTIEKNM